MINNLKESLWKQFGASIDMLKNAITEWPEEYWNATVNCLLSTLPYTP
jgi:hypothetical protein